MTFHVALGAGAAMLLQILGGIIISLGVGRGVVPEELMDLSAHIIRTLSIILATVMTWVTENNKPLLVSAITAVISILFPIMTAMLFWQIDRTVMITGIGVAILSFWLSAWGMNRLENKRNSSIFKKHYR